MKLYIDRRATFGFFAAFIILVCLGYYTYKNNQDFIETRGLVLHTTEVLHHIQETQANAIRIEEILAKYIITSDSSFLKLYQDEIKKAAIHYNNLRELSKDNDEQQTLMDSFVIAGREKLILHQQIIDTMKSSKSAAGQLINDIDNIESTQRVTSITESMKAEENQLLESRIAKSRVDMKEFQATFWALMTVNIIIVCIVFYYINKTFKARLLAEQKTKLLNGELEAFTYSVSHDLRAPLRSIRGFTELLKEEYGSKMDDEGNRLLQIVMKNASRMGQLIDDLLDFSRLGRKTLSYSKIDTQEMVAEVIQESMVLEKREVDWDVKHLDEIRGDVSMIRLVWNNLLSNALKYSRNTTKTKIEIGSYAEKGNTVFYVKDNGVGFDMAYSDKLFKVFSRLHKETEFEGTGVGLALVHRIISKHDGKIWVESQVNKGATFMFYLNNPTL